MTHSPTPTNADDVTVRQEALRSLVKPLLWDEPHPSHTYPVWQARHYEVGFEAVIDTGCALIYGKFPTRINGSMVVQKFNTIEDAKRHVQKVYEDRILTALAIKGGE